MCAPSNRLDILRTVLNRLLVLIFTTLLQTRRAEVKMAATLVHHNVPLAVTDHLGPLLKECFKDSTTAQDYRCARTKTTCIVNGALAPHFKQELVVHMKEGPYTLITDGSNDTGISHTEILHLSQFYFLTFLYTSWVCEDGVHAHVLFDLICCHCRKREDEPLDSPDL